MIVLAGAILYYNLFNVELTITNFALVQTIAFAINFVVILTGIIIPAMLLHIKGIVESRVEYWTNLFNVRNQNMHHYGTK